MAAIAIIGGSGFIGSHLARSLNADGHEVIVADIVRSSENDCTYRLADVRDFDSLRAALRGAAVVYNLAALHRDDIRPASRYEEVNTTGAINVCRACRELGIRRVVFISSVAVYGKAPPNTSEGGKAKPVTAYGRSKLLAEGVHREWQAEDPSDRSLVIVRPTVVFGEGNRGNVYELVRQILSGRFIMVGTGGSRKSMAYVGNLGAFLIHILGVHPGTHIFNYVDKPDYSMQDLVDTVVQSINHGGLSRIRIPYPIGYIGGSVFDVLSAITGRKFPISAQRVRKFCSTTTFSSCKVESTGFQAPVSLHVALMKTVRHEAGIAAPR